MARPASQATAGYFPTPEGVLPAIARLVSLEREPHERPICLDPCAGTGTAILEIAARVSGVDLEAARGYCQAIELETTRAEALAQRLPRGAARQGDALTFGIDATPGASVLYLNPPYDLDPDFGRLEQRFLARFTEALAPGGALLFVVPGYALEASAAWLASWYTSLRVLRFPDPLFDHFKQVVLIGLRREERTAPEPSALRRLGAASSNAAALPVLGEAVSPPLVVRVPYAYLSLTPQAIDVEDLLAHARPFEVSAAPMGLDRDARHVLGAPLPVALPPRPAHIALALAAGLLNGRRLRPDDPTRFPTILAKGVFARALQVVDQRRNKDGEVTGEVCVQQPRLDIHVLRLDTLDFRRLALGTEPSGASTLDAMNTADLLEHYRGSLAALVREQLPALHDHENPAHQIALPPLARKPYRRQAALIQAGLKLLATGENPQLLAEVGVGKSTMALSIAGALMPAHFEGTCEALRGAGFDPRRLRPVERLLIVCPPHLLTSWTDQARAVLPEAAVQVVEKPSDLDRDATIYILSREVAKLGSRIAGVSGPRCPDCGHPLPAEPEALAAKRLYCTATVRIPQGRLARIAKDLALGLYRVVELDLVDRLLPILEQHPAAYRRLLARRDDGIPAEPFGGSSLPALRHAYGKALALVERTFLRRQPWEAGFWEPFRLGGYLSILVGEVEGYATACRAFARERQTEGDPSLHLREIEDDLEVHLEELDAVVDDDRSVLLRRLLEGLLDTATWGLKAGCGAPLHGVTPHPRRFPLARLIVRRHRRLFDLLVIDEAHELATAGSAQQKAAHRLVQLPGVPTIALTGSLMGGYASSLFANAWALSRRFRSQFDLDDRAAFVGRYGYRRLLVSVGDGKEKAPRERTYGAQSDRTDGGAPEIRQLGEAPGVLPLYVLEHVLPTGLVMHKADLDDELPPLSEEPVAVRKAADDLLDAKLLNELDRLRRLLVARIREDRTTERAGLLWGAMSELPSYVDLANEECGPFVLAYPDHAGGQVVATGASFPAAWRSPKERWLLGELRAELERGRRILVFLRHTGNRGFVARIGRLVQEELGVKPVFLDAAKVATRRRERWLDDVIADGCRVLLVHPKAVQTGLNNLTAFQTAVWYEGPDYDARVTRQANGRPHRIGQTEPVRLIYPYYADTVQKTALDLVARKITASLQVDGLSLAGALEAAGALSEEDRLHAEAALAVGEALWRAAASER